MAKLSKEDRENVKLIRLTIDKLYTDVISLKKIKNKTENDYKTIIKYCKEVVSQLNLLSKYGFKAELWTKHIDPSYWQAELDKFVGNDIIKPKSKVKKDTKSLIEKSEQTKSENLYYIMLCWLTKKDYFVCDSTIENIKKYFEYLKTKFSIEYFDTTEDVFPERKEYTCTYKLRASEDVYNTILSSAEYILEISSSYAQDMCNIGIFGKKIS